MSYSCLRHQYYSPKEPCGACTRERDMQMMGQMQSSNQEAMMRANVRSARWPQDVFERLEGERDAAIKLAATYRVALEKASDFASKVVAAWEGDPEVTEREAKDLDAYIIRALGGSPSGSDPK